MSKRSFVLGSVVLLLSLALVVPSYASQPTTTSDPNDTAGALDVSSLAGLKDGTKGPLKVQIEMFHAWDDSLLDASGENRIFVLFNINNDPDAEYVGEISTTDGVMSITITGKGNTLDPLPVERINDTTIRVTIPGASPSNPGGTIKVAAKSKLVKSSGDCAPACLDRAKDHGWLAINP